MSGEPIALDSRRDAADVPLTHTFGPNTLANFRVWTDDLGPGSP